MRVKIANFSWCGTDPQTPSPPPPNTFRTNHTCLPTPCLARTVLNMEQYFHNHRSMQNFFTSGIGPDILMNVLEDCIILLVWTAWVLFSFYLLTSSPFMVEFCPDTQK